MLASLGWTPALEDEFAPHAADGLEPARVAVEHRGAYVLYTARGERPAELSGRFRHDADERGDLPAVGDWVAVTPTEPALVQAVLPRRTKFSRHGGERPRPDDRAGRGRERRRHLPDRGLDGDLNVRRLERYLTLGWESGAEPVVVLTKADLCADLEAALYEVESVAVGVPVHAVSNVTGEGIDALRPYFAEGRTVAALGSSGVGKSSLVNRLAGEELMAVGDLRADGKGRHTTTNRQLLLLPGGGLFLDTPGMRELRLWDSEEGLADRVRRRDRGGRALPVQRLLTRGRAGLRRPRGARDGTLDEERYVSWRKLQGELLHLAMKQDSRLRAEARKERRRFARSQRKASW